MLRETEQDKLHQTKLLEAFAKFKKLSYNQFPSNSGKYRIDGYLYDNDNNIKAWVECKWYSKEAYCYLNIPKYNELLQLSINTSQPSYLLFRVPGRWGWITIHTGHELGAEYKIQHKGGTQKGRATNVDDVEPLVVLDKKYIVWGHKSD